MWSLPLQIICQEKEAGRLEKERCRLDSELCIALPLVLIPALLCSPEITMDCSCIAKDRGAVRLWRAVERRTPGVVVTLVSNPAWHFNAMTTIDIWLKCLWGILDVFWGETWTKHWNLHFCHPALHPLTLYSMSVTRSNGVNVAQKTSVKVRAEWAY